MKNKKKIGYYAETIFVLILAIVWLSFLGYDVINGRNWSKIVEDLIWTGITILITLYNYHEAKKIGIVIEDDERDNYLIMKTESQMFKLTHNLILVLGVVFLITGSILSKNNGVTVLVIVLTSVAVILLFFWMLIIVIELILLFINYRHD